VKELAEMNKGSVGVPYPKLDPDLQVLHVFGPPGSGSICQRYGSGSGIFKTESKL
jgi:hypothetical protein